MMRAGLIRQPKWGHLKELHAAIKSCSKLLLHGAHKTFSLGPLQQVRKLRTVSFLEIGNLCLISFEKHLSKLFLDHSTLKIQAYVFQGNSGQCAAFLVNNDGKQEVEVLFQSNSYKLPQKSISILPDCKTMTFNTAKVWHLYTQLNFS